MLASVTRFASLDAAFLCVVRAIVENGARVAPRAVPTIELRGVSFFVDDPRRRYVSLRPRHWSFAYALGELCWHLRGSRALGEIEFYSRRWRAISADGRLIPASSYGAKIFQDCPGSGNQWSTVRRLLSEDHGTRRAVLVLAQPPTESFGDALDVSCANTVQFFARNGRLDAVVSMRSNDAILGLPYDVFLFTMLQELMALELNLSLGSYQHSVGSIHIYESDIDWAREIMGAQPQLTEPMPEMSAHDGVADLLRIEQASRERTLASGHSEGADSYWGALASVLIFRNQRRRGAMVDLEDCVRNPLYRALAKMGTGGAAQFAGEQSRQ